jgi:hypothetical protein
MHWRELYRCAVLETNPVLFEQTVLEAELAASSRLSELLNIPNSSAGDEEEKRDLTTTLTKNGRPVRSTTGHIAAIYGPPAARRPGPAQSGPGHKTLLALMQQATENIGRMHLLEGRAAPRKVFRERLRTLDRKSLTNCVRRSSGNWFGRPQTSSGRLFFLCKS